MSEAVTDRLPERQANTTRRPPDWEWQPDRTPTSADKTPPDSARPRFRSARARRPAYLCLRRAPAPPPPAADPARSHGQAGRMWNVTPSFRRVCQTSRASASKNQESWCRPVSDRDLCSHLDYPPGGDLEIIRGVVGDASEHDEQAILPARHPGMGGRLERTPRQEEG